jgi:dihydroneopterin aldolase
MATLILSSIGFEGRHGASAAERRTTRRFEVDVEIETRLEKAENSDRLADTLDVRDIAEVIVSIGWASRTTCWTSLARRMVNALLAKVPSARIRLELRKLSPPYCGRQPGALGRAHHVGLARAGIEEERRPPHPARRRAGLSPRGEAPESGGGRPWVGGERFFPGRGAEGALYLSPWGEVAAVCGGG